jgi:hypothetical protein
MLSSMASPGADTMMSTNDSLIEDISKIRVDNNKQWMNILRLAFLHAPKEAKIIMKKITENDRKVSALTEKLAIEPIDKENCQKCGKKAKWITSGRYPHGPVSACCHLERSE